MAILSTAEPMLTPEKTIALFIKKHLLAKTSTSVSLMMKQHYMQMKLISLNNVQSCVLCHGAGQTDWSNAGRLEGAGVLQAGLDTSIQTMECHLL